MRNLKSIEEVIATSQRPVYVLCADPSWEHFHPERLPTPIAEWLARNCPEVAVGRLASFPRPGARLRVEKYREEVINALVQSPIFLIGFNEMQAAAFVADWGEPPYDLPKASEFYFFTCGSPGDLPYMDGENNGEYVTQPQKGRSRGLRQRIERLLPKCQTPQSPGKPTGPATSARLMSSCSNALAWISSLAYALRNKRRVEPPQERKRSACGVIAGSSALRYRSAVDFRRSAASTTVA